jgi:hypothetical protein
MKKLVTFVFGLLLGALSWGMAYALSGKFEPFDSDVGFFATQTILSSAAFLAGFKKGISDSFVLVAGGYIGMNSYAYTFGGSEAQAWAFLGAITTVALLFYPVLAGLLGSIVRHVRSRLRQRETKEG